MSSDYHPADTHSFLTKADLKDSLNTFSNLLSTAKIYRLALITLSNATAAFAKSLEDAARLKGTQAIQLEQEQQLESTTDSIGSSPHTPHSSHHDPTHSHCSNPAEKLLAASGLHFLTANLEQVLSDTFKKSFELPLLNLYESYRTQLAHQQNRYESLLSLKTKAIRETELRNMNQGGSRHSRNTPRDLDSFRRGLKELQDQVEQVESLKHSYYLQVAKGERQVWNKVAENISLVVKSEVEVYDRIASKPISDPTLEAMVASIPDPFDAYNPVETIDGSMSGTGGGAGEIYSILNPLSSLLLGSPQKARRSVDLNHSLASLQRHLQTPSPNGSLIHPHLNSATHWAESVADHTGQQPEPLLTQLDQPLPGPSSSSSPSSVNETNDPRRNVCSLLSTDSAITATPANPALPDEPRISPSSSSETADTTVVLDHPPQPADNSSIPHPSLDVPPPHIHRLSTTNSIQPHIDEVDSLLGEPPPSGLDLSDSDT
ncbi:hypothetical protein PtA15_18A58 [Puccinia triticina]|uniref:IMD domain-containing protein n=1 Tax=Puccinia triticina TaxID=208348 RepID=A0ABY7D9M4_9BASI|nr:uncharacterized protein PtA15_18A58 [Puccinia triticina]WAQ93002.1 hypothetical protein PtA15_18A58 [Puccinia triticina]